MNYYYHLNYFFFFIHVLKLINQIPFSNIFFPSKLIPDILSYYAYYPNPIVLINLSPILNKLKKHIIKSINGKIVL